VRAESRHGLFDEPCDQFLELPLHSVRVSPALPRPPASHARPRPAEALPVGRWAGGLTGMI